MEILNINDFDYDGSSYDDIMINISRHCILTEENEIKIYNGKSDYYLDCYSEKKAYFPKVVYAESVNLRRDITLTNVLPDIKKMGELAISYSDIDDFGDIQEIGYFNGMSIFTNSRYRKENNIKTKCEPLGDDMYRFTSDKGSWDIRVNNYT